MPLHLLLLEHVVVEVLLQLLVREVDAELLQVVVLERFEAVDVQHAHAGDAVLGKKRMCACVCVVCVCVRARVRDSVRVHVYACVHVCACMCVSECAANWARGASLQRRVHADLEPSPHLVLADGGVDRAHEPVKHLGIDDLAV